MCDHLPMIACVQNPLYSRKIGEGDLSPIFPEGGGGGGECYTQPISWKLALRHQSLAFRPRLLKIRSA